MEASSSSSASSAAGLAFSSGTMVATALIERAKTPQVRASFSIWAISAGSLVSSSRVWRASIRSMSLVCSLSLQSLGSSRLPGMTQRYGASGRGSFKTL